MWALRALELRLFAGSCCRCLALGLCVVARSAKQLEVIVLVVADTSCVVDVVYVEWWCCCPAVLAGSLVSCEDAFAGCCGDVLCVVAFPRHRVPCSLSAHE